MHTTPLSLLERLRTIPDESSWQRFFVIYSPLVRNWLARHGVRGPDADDIAQDVCTVIARELLAFVHSGREGAFRLWVRKIVLNRLRGYWREKRNNRDLRGEYEMSLLEDAESELSRLWDREHDEHVARRLMEMIEPEFSAKTWRAFRRQVIDEAPPAQVASELGISVNAVLIAKSRVLRRLRQEGKGLLDALG